MKMDTGIDTQTGFVRLPGFLLLLCLSYSVLAEDIIQSYKDLTVNANLEMADGKDFKHGMVLILHGTMGHNKMELIESMQNALLDNDYSSLAINLSLKVDNRHGFFDCARPHQHVQDNALGELTVWVNWLKQKGVSDIALIAHSRGANQAMVYAAEQRAHEVKHLVMLAPGVDDTGRGYKNRFGEVLDKNLILMNRRIAAGKGDKPVGNIDFWFCPRAQVSANSFISYYGEQSKFRQFLTTMPKIDIPTLVITGTVDEVVPEVEKVVMPMVDNKRIFLTTIEGAGHFFRDFNIEEAMEATVEFLDKTR